MHAGSMHSDAADSFKLCCQLVMQQMSRYLGYCVYRSFLTAIFYTPVQTYICPSKDEQKRDGSVQAGSV
jgi:hypothetical protein